MFSRLLPAVCRVAGLWILLAGILVAGGCSQPERPSAHSAAAARTEKPGATEEPLKVTGTEPPAGEAVGDHLVVVFNQPLALDEKTTVPLTFVPPLEGSFDWGPNFIGFKPKAVPFESVFEATLAPQLKAANGARLDPATGALRFTAFEFKATQLWKVGTDPKQTVLALIFSAPVDFNKLGGHLQLTNGRGQNVPFSLAAGTSYLNVRLISALQTALPLKLTVKAGTPEALGRFATLNDTVLATEEGSQLGVAMADFEETTSHSQKIALVFNEGVNEADLRNHLKVYDVSTTVPLLLPYRLSSAAQMGRWGVQIAASDPNNVKIRLEISPGMKSQSGEEMIHGVSRNLTRLAQLLIAGIRWSDGGPDGMTLNVGISTGVDPVQLRQHFTVEPMPEHLNVVASGGNEFLVHADWKGSTSYKITILPGMPFLGWAVLRQPVTSIVTSPVHTITRYLEMPAVDKFYMPRRYGSQVPVNTRGISTLNMRLFKMIPGNIAVAVDALENGQGSSVFASRWSVPAGEKTLHLDPLADKVATTTVDLDSLTSAPLHGVYCLVCGSDEYDPRRHNRDDDDDDDVSYYGTTMRLVLKTDLGLLAHWHDDELVVFAHNLFTLAPAVGTQVSVYSFKNVLLGTARTDGQGLAHLKGFKTINGEPSVVVAETKDDQPLAFSCERR